MGWLRRIKRPFRNLPGPQVDTSSFWKRGYVILHFVKNDILRAFELFLELYPGDRLWYFLRARVLRHAYSVSYIMPLVIGVSGRASPGIAALPATVAP